MKKVMVLNVIISVILLSCSDVLDDLDVKELNHGNTIDSLGYIQNPDIVTDTIGESTNVQELKWLGLHYTEEELQIWRTRVDEGMYIKKGDVDVNTPGDWGRIVENANKFKSNPQQDRITKTYRQGGFVHTKIILLRDAAFYALVVDDKELQKVVKNEILWLCTKSGMKFSATEKFKSDNDGGWWDAEWLTRLLIAYDYSKANFTGEEQSIVKDWFLAAAHGYAYSINKELEANFPNRLSRNYSIRKQAASSIDGSSSPDRHAYFDKNGNAKNYISNLSKWYNNRRSTGVGFFSLAGVLFNDRDLIDQGKLYVEEWIKFSMFPDGTTGEYQRNGDYEYSSAGRHYNAINIQTAVILADALARKGDFSLYNFKTSEGLWGTEGGEKSILTGVMNYLDELDYTVQRYCDDEKCLQGSLKLTNENRIDAIADRGKQKGKQWVSEIWFAPMGNHYWQNQRIADGYLRRTPNSPAYGNNIATAGPTGPSWGGSGYIYPGLLFMYGQTEDKVWPYPGAQNQ